MVNILNQISADGKNRGEKDRREKNTDNWARHNMINDYGYD